MHLKSENILIAIPAGWADITAGLEDRTIPTIAKSDGKGALQFSTVYYKSGKLPGITIAELSEMLNTFAANKGFLRKSQLVVSDQQIKSVAANYSNGDDFVRIWYCPDGKNTA